MSALRGLALAAAVALAGWGWLRFVHDPAVRARAALHARDAVVDSMVKAWKDSVRVVWERDSVAIATADSIAEALRRRGPEVRTETNTVIRLIPDPAIRDSVMRVLARERALADSVHRADSLRVAERDSALAARDRLLRAAHVTIDSLVKLRGDWRQEARQSPVGLGCAVGPGAGTAGFQPVVVACGLVLRF